MKKIGFSGAHRTGKTTLARAFAARNGLPFHETKVTSTFAQQSARAMESMTGPEGFKARLAQQEIITHHIAKILIYSEPKSIFDRTMLDVYAYTSYYLRQQMNTFNHDGSHIEALHRLLGEVVRRMVLQDFTFIIQTGIPYHEDGTKASQGSQQFINDLIIKAAEAYLPANRYFVMPQDIVSFDERMEVVYDVCKTLKLIKGESK
nr:MAG TPA: AAA domain protein [Caudoviricetes sp.]